MAFAKLLPNQCPALCYITTVVPGKPSWNTKEARSKMVTVETVWGPVGTGTNQAKGEPKASRVDPSEPVERQVRYHKLQCERIKILISYIFCILTFFVLSPSDLHDSRQHILFRLSACCFGVLTKTKTTRSIST